MVSDNLLPTLIDEVRRLAAGPDAGTALQRISMRLRSAVDHYDWVGFYLAIADERMLLLGPFEGEPTEHIRIPYGTGICGQAATRGETFVVPDVSEQTNYLACSLSTRAEIVLPIFHEGSFVGELDIDSHTRDPFTSFDDELLGAVVEATAPLVAALIPPSAR